MDRLQRICDSLGPGHIEALLLKILPNPFTTEDEAAGYRYELSVLQAEFSSPRCSTAFAWAKHRDEGRLHVISAIRCGA